MIAYCYICNRPITHDGEPEWRSYRFDGTGEAHGICLGDYGWDKIAEDEFWRVLFLPRYCVAVYDCDRSMGGPEEGGWSYETGHLVMSIDVNNAEAAHALQAALEIEYPYTGRRGYYSKNGPDFSVRVMDRHMEAEWTDWFDPRLQPVEEYPEYRPRYE